MSALHVGKTSVPKSNLSLLLMLSMLLGKLSDSDRLIKIIFLFLFRICFMLISLHMKFQQMGGEALYAFHTQEMQENTHDIF